jgi:hypothetical protein
LTSGCSFIISSLLLLYLKRPQEAGNKGKYAVAVAVAVAVAAAGGS